MADHSPSPLVDGFDDTYRQSKDIRGLRFILRAEASLMSIGNVSNLRLGLVPGVHMQVSNEHL